MTKREEQAKEYAAEQNFSYVKVYGKRGDTNTFSLTPEEREAVECASVGALNERIHAVLLGLLERTK